MFGCSLASALSSASIVLTVLIFPKLKKKVSSTVAMQLALANVCAAVPTIVGEQYNGTPLCWFQGIGANFGQLATMFWTVLITNMMYQMIINGKPAAFKRAEIALCWTLPLIFTLLPLINATYGSPLYDDDLLPYGYCWVVEDDRTPSWGLSFWGWFSFYAWVWLCIGIIFIMYARILKRLSGDKIPKSTKAALLGVIARLRVYPIIIVVSWLWTCITDVREELLANPGSEFISFLLPCLQGTFTGLAFFIGNEDARSHWRVFIASRGKNRTGPEPKKSNSTKKSGGSGNELRSGKKVPSDTPSTVTDDASSASSKPHNDPSVPGNSSPSIVRRHSSFWDGGGSSSEVGSEAESPSPSPGKRSLVVPAAGFTPKA